ncbi:MAG: class I SAM-dependent methyltransferase [archaeon]
MKNEELFSKKWRLYKPQDKVNLVAMMKERYLQDFLFFAKKYGVKKVLDAGCGWGAGAIVLEEAGFNVTAIDLFIESICATKKDGLLKSTIIYKANLEEPLSFKDREFDAVVCAGVLHHVDDSKTLPELKRVASKMLYIGVYGKRGVFFSLAEVLLRRFLRFIPFKVNLALLRAVGYSDRVAAQRLEHIYIKRAVRYSEKDLIKLIGDDYFCVFNRKGNFINLIAIKKIG